MDLTASTYDLLKELDDFSYTLSSSDRVWDIICPGEANRSDDVFDVMHYDDLGRFKRRITPFITWEPLPVLKPGDA